MHTLDIWHTGYRFCIKHLPSDGKVSLEEVGNVGKAWVALAMVCGPCTDSVGFSTIKLMLSSLSIANTGIPPLD